MFGKMKTWFVGWVKLAESLVVIISFGNFNPDWSISLIGYFLLKEIDKHIQKQ